MASGPISSWQVDGKTVETVEDLFFWTPTSLQMLTEAMKLEEASPWKKIYDQPRQHIEKQRQYYANKCLSQFSSVQLLSRVRLFAAP